MAAAGFNGEPLEHSPANQESRTAKILKEGKTVT